MFEYEYSLDSEGAVLVTNSKGQVTVWDDGEEERDHYMTREEIEAVADQHKLGAIHFEFRVALNTGRTMENGYVYDKEGKHLFCKHTEEKGFYLCNEYRELVK